MLRSTVVTVVATVVVISAVLLAVVVVVVVVVVLIVAVVVVQYGPPHNNIELSNRGWFFADTSRNYKLSAGHGAQMLQRDERRRKSETRTFKQQ